MVEIVIVCIEGSEDMAVAWEVCHRLDPLPHLNRLDDSAFVPLVSHVSRRGRTLQAELDGKRADVESAFELVLERAASEETLETLISKFRSFHLTAATDSIGIAIGQC